eukprot:FR735037.1.p1 GENE.FR735037.1~~FR735037.1.p1  ORF type:complete len:183 (-),score=27.35 FR735037.1:432-980(-)
MGAGKQISPGKQVRPRFRPRAQFNPHKRDQKLELPREWRPALELVDSPGFWTLGVTQCGRFFFFFFFFFGGKGIGKGLKPYPDLITVPFTHGAKSTENCTVYCFLLGFWFLLFLCRHRRFLAQICQSGRSRDTAHVTPLMATLVLQLWRTPYAVAKSVTILVWYSGYLAARASPRLEIMVST